MVLMANRYILPAAYQLPGQLARERGGGQGGRRARAKETQEARSTRSCKLTDECKVRVDKLQELLEHEANGDAEKHAKYFRDKVVPAMVALREVGDELEAHRPARHLAAADLPGDAVRQVSEVQTNLRSGNLRPSYWTEVLICSALSRSPACVRPGARARLAENPAQGASRRTSKPRTAPDQHDVRRLRGRAGPSSTARSRCRRGTLDIRPESNGGVQIQRGTGSAYGITACIAAGARRGRRAGRGRCRPARHRRQPRARHRRRSGNRSASNWSVQLIVTAPEGASIDARDRERADRRPRRSRARSRCARRTVRFRSTRSPAASRARASNGPISVDGSRGEFDIETANGPIDVRLAGQRWDGHLDARASERAADGARSRRTTSRASRSPRRSTRRGTAARLPASGSGNRDWDDRTRSLRIGTDPVVVRLSTVNGPVTVSER